MLLSLAAFWILVLKSSDSSDDLSRICFPPCSAIPNSLPVSSDDKSVMAARSSISASGFARM